MANPYLVNAVTLAAGLDGIERKLELPAETTAATLRMSERELEQAGYTQLPRNLEEALDIFEDSQFMKDALGEHIHSFFLTKNARSGRNTLRASRSGKSTDISPTRRGQLVAYGLM